MKTGWETGALASISEVFTDGNWIESKDQATDGIRLVQTGNVGEGVFKERRDKARWIDEDTFARLNCFEVLPGDCLISRLPDPVGRACLIPDTGDKMITAVDCSIVRPDETKIDPRLLVYFTQSREYLRDVDERCSGTTRRRISRENLGKVPIPLPPLEEQQRIVGVLDEAFEGLACARKNAEVNLQNARELFESYAGSVFRPHDDPEESAYSTMVGAVCDIQSGAGFPLQYQGEKNGDFPFYKVSDMNLPGNEWELHSANHYVSDKVRLELRARIFPQDSIVFPKVGGAIATNKKRIIQVAGCVDNNVMGLIPDQAKVVPEYLHEWLRAFDIYEFSNKANPPSITQGTVFGWPLRVPSRDEQMQVVATAVELREHTETLRKSYEDRMQDLDDLRQSLLQKAFAGKLT